MKLRSRYSAVVLCSVTIIVTALLSIPVLAEEITGDRPEYFGFAPAYPIEIPKFKAVVYEVPVSDLSFNLLEILIDTVGACVTISSRAENDSLLGENLKFYLQAINFHPALENGLPVLSVLPVLAAARVGVRQPWLIFPLGVRQEITDLDLYDEAYRLNGRFGPIINRFPEYSGVPTEGDTLRFPFALIQVSLDERGEPTSTELCYTNQPDASDLLLSSILWSDFEPARIGDAAVASQPLVAVALYPSLAYPVKAWNRESRKSMFPQNRASIRLIADTCDLLFQPVPKGLPGNRYKVLPALIPRYDQIHCSVTIDTLGRAKLRRETKQAQLMAPLLNDLQSQMKFYPAVDFDGNVRIFRGFLTLMLDGSVNVRVTYHWLGDLEEIDQAL